ncbi:hypothetical protein KAR91_66330 [Candidatus Pacearchaeota archaeon]|nr:hypothetical protein [Candidatus Pacearchaeota archaeon]
MNIDKYLYYLQETGLGPGDRPEGWNAKSVKKAGVSLAKSVGKDSPKDKDFFDRCVDRMNKHMGDGAEGYCASLKDRAHGSTYWRGKDKTPKQAGKDVKAHQNVGTKR